MYNYLKMIKVIGVAFPLFIGLDAVWIGLIMNNFYKASLGSILRVRDGMLSPNVPGALIVWFLIVFGSYIFVVPRIEGLPFALQFVYGALFGLILYGVYDLTNYAILRDWPLSITLADIGWGMFACGVLAVILKVLNNFFD
jgi:uncharacterized membrane protein